MEMMESSLDIGQKNLLKWRGVWVVLFVDIFFLAIGYSIAKYKEARPYDKQSPEHHTCYNQP